MQPIANFLRLQDRHCLVECRRLEIQKQRDGDGMEIANSIRRLDGGAGEDALAPRLLTQSVGEQRRELFKLIDILRLAKQGKRKFARLFKVAIVNSQPLHRAKPGGEHVEHVGIELHPRDQDCETCGKQRNDAAPTKPAPSGDRFRNEITNPHLRTTNEHESTLRCQPCSRDRRSRRSETQNRKRKVSAPATWRTRC